jgi:hypothetical protein
MVGSVGLLGVDGFTFLLYEVAYQAAKRHRDQAVGSMGKFTAPWI